MHGQNHIKFVCSKQAKTIHEYKSLKRRLYKTTAALWHNKTCRKKHLTPKYISIKEQTIRSAIKTSVASSWHFISIYAVLTLPQHAILINL